MFSGNAQFTLQGSGCLASRNGCQRLFDSLQAKAIRQRIRRFNKFIWTLVRIEAKSCLQPAPAGQLGIIALGSERRDQRPQGVAIRPESTLPVGNPIEKGVHFGFKCGGANIQQSVGQIAHRPHHTNGIGVTEESNAIDITPDAETRPGVTASDRGKIVCQTPWCRWTAGGDALPP